MEHEPGAYQALRGARLRSRDPPASRERRRRVFRTYLGERGGGGGGRGSRAQSADLLRNPASLCLLLSRGLQNASRFLLPHLYLAQGTRRQQSAVERTG